ncbi:MAG: RICIN domain-containing protein [Clostridium sp.]|nr:RICIN domain-containing protein [Clostridium sp.]
MRHDKVLLFFLFCAGWCSRPAQAGSDEYRDAVCGITAQPVTDRLLPFRLSQQGVVREVEWGADEAWIHEQNLRRCLLFMGRDNVSVIRVSFQPTHALVDGDLQQEQKDAITERLRLLGFAAPDVKLTLNCDHPSVDAWYGQNADRWVQLIDVTARYFQEAGYEIVSVAPFNEPDYGWNQWVNGSQDIWEPVRMNGFGEIASALQANSRFDNIRICGGNTLNCDRALPWFESLNEHLDEGNTHQLAGSFDNFANFYITLRQQGKHATADEMHNVMEAMVGLEYGLQTGIWWGPAEYARGEFCKASHGERLGYAEHRPNWTAASVYRAPDGRVQAFGGTSERQAVTTTYRLLSKERDVFYNGHGPQREYVMELPGGNGYQAGQTNAEQIINITWGEDVEPVVDGTYLLTNKYNRKLLEMNGDKLCFDYYSSNDKFKWEVRPVDPRIGGDFSYYYITSVSSSQALDVLNWSLDNNAEVIAYAVNNNANQQWYLEYAGNNWFYIRNRHSSLCLTMSGDKVIQSVKDGNDAQLWRFNSPGIRPRFIVPAAPDGLTAQPLPAAIRLSWNPAAAATSTFTLLRSETSGSDYCIIARNLTDTSFVDNKAEIGHTYYYIVKTVDQSFNTSASSDEVAATPTDAETLVANYDFEEQLFDRTHCCNHASTLNNPSYVVGKTGQYALNLDGSTGFAQLPATIVNHRQLTIATWFYWSGGEAWQRIFDFGNGEDEYIFLTPNAGSNRLRLAIKNNGEEQIMESNVSLTAKLNRWIHVAVTLDNNGVNLYQDGALVASTTDLTLRPSDFRPVMNYIGRSQFVADPLFKGRIDDFRIYNYALSAKQVNDLANGLTDGLSTPTRMNGILHADVLPGGKILKLQCDTGTTANYQIFDLQGRSLLSAHTGSNEPITLDISTLPEGVYVVKALYGNRQATAKFMIRR